MFPLTPRWSPCLTPWPPCWPPWSSSRHGGGRRTAGPERPGPDVHFPAQCDQPPPGGWPILVVFFLAVLFAALTSLVNLFEAPTATLQELFHLKRPAAVAIIGERRCGRRAGHRPIVSHWMDVCSIYICPIGALLAGVMFFWVCGKDYVLEQVNLSRSRPLGRWFTHGQVSVLRRHSAGADSRCSQGRHWLKLIQIRPCGPPSLGGPQGLFIQRAPVRPAPFQTAPSPNDDQKAPEAPAQQLYLHHRCRPGGRTRRQQAG